MYSMSLYVSSLYFLTYILKYILKYVEDLNHTFKDICMYNMFSINPSYTFLRFVQHYITIVFSSHNQEGGLP